MDLVQRNLANEEAAHRPRAIQGGERRIVRCILCGAHLDTSSIPQSHLRAPIEEPMCNRCKEEDWRTYSRFGPHRYVHDVEGAEEAAQLDREHEIFKMRSFNINRR